MKEINRGMWTIGYTGQSPERLKLHMKNMQTFDVKTLRAKGGPCDGDYFGLPWPCYGTPEIKHPGSPNLYDQSRAMMEGGGCFRANFGVERDGVSLLAEDGSFPKGSDLTTGYPEFDHVLMKKLGWWDELSDAEKKAAEGKNWKTDLSGGIQRVTMKHGAHPWGNAKARAVVWNFPDGVPQHREPLYSPRPDLVAKYPTHDDKKAFWRLPTLYKSVQEANVKEKVRRKVPAGSDERPARRVRRRRRGDAQQPLARGVAAGMLHRDQSGRCEQPRRPRRRIRVGEDADGRADQGEDAGDRARRQGHDVHPVPFLRLVDGQGHARVLSGRFSADHPRRSGEHGDDLRLRLGHDDAGNQDDAVSGREVHGVKRRNSTWPE
jgi:hypothetical protein